MDHPEPGVECVSSLLNIYLPTCYPGKGHMGSCSLSQAALGTRLGDGMPIYGIHIHTHHWYTTQVNAICKFPCAYLWTPGGDQTQGELHTHWAETR